MWSLKKPELDVTNTYLTCISRVKETTLKERLETILDKIVLAAQEYERAAKIGELNAIATTNKVGGLVSKQEMATVYTSRMARKGSPGRPIYDKLLSSCPYDRCPLCGQRTVSTLDHHLPIAFYPELVVTPVNLVPVCMDCNKAKLDIIPKKNEEATLHPYFDYIQDERWLYARIEKNEPPSLQFFVVPHQSWDNLKKLRVSWHFEVFKLAKLYAVHAAQELVNIRYHLSELLNATGPHEVQKHLNDMAVSHEHASKNSWQLAMYEACANSDWFCDGGFN